jgi:hypothetical protein
MSVNKRVNSAPQMLKCVFFFALVFISLSSFSQSITSSPYSRYGLGDLQAPGLAQNFALGGGGIGWRSDTLTPSYINTINPASYSAMRITAIETGLMSSYTQFNGEGQKYALNNTSFSYLAVGVPVKRWWGLSFGIMPYSSVGYNIHTTKSNDTSGVIDYTYQGTGGINKAYLGNGFKLLKEKFSKRTGIDLSAGFNASYLFGAVNNIRHVSFETPNYEDTRVDESLRIHDFAFDFGLQFKFRIDSVMKTNPKLAWGCAYNDHKHHDSITVYNNCKVDSTHKSFLSKKYFVHRDNDSTHLERRKVKTDIEDLTFSFGLTYTPPMGLSSSEDYLAQTYIQPGSFEIYKDTIVNNVNKSTITHLPAKFGAGISINRTYHWNLVADYSYQQWTGYSLDGINQGLQNSMQGSLGFQFQPALRGSYFSIIRYRFGVRYNETYLQLGDTRITEQGLTFGAAFPVAISHVKRGEFDVNQYRNYSMINVSVELGQRGTNSNGLIQETYGRVVLGFTINDRWFQRFKYND